MRSCFGIALFLCCILLPASADLSDFQPIVEYSLPADIMLVKFADETWVYRLYEDGTVRKMVNKKRYVAACNEEEPKNRKSNEQLTG